MNYLACNHGCFLDAPSGSARVAWDIALMMRRHGHAATLACFDVGAAADSVREEQGVRVLRVALRLKGGMNPWPHFIETMARGITRHLGGEQWDVVHTHLPHLHTAARRAIGAGPRYVYTFHSPVVEEQWVRWRWQGFKGRIKRWFGTPILLRHEASALKESEAVQALSEFSRGEIQRFHGLGKKARVIPHWRRAELRRTMQKAEARRRLGWPQDRAILFTVRRHAHRMGLEGAVEAIGPLAASGRCFFAVGGDGELRPALERRAAQLGAGAACMPFLGRMSEEALHLAYQAADLFVLPTEALECFGLITLEAMSFGCPVLGTDAGATPELLAPITPELIVPARNAAALREKVEAFLAGRVTAPAAEAIEAFVEERFSQEVIEPALLEWMGL